MEWKRMYRRFAADENAQDLIEYSLLLAFICLASAALFLNISQTINQIWSAISSRLAS